MAIRAKYSERYSFLQGFLSFSLLAGIALSSCKMPDWNNDLESFVADGRAIAYLDSSSYVQGSAAVNTDVRPGSPVTVTVKLNNPKALALDYTVNVDGALVDGTITPPASTTGSVDGLTTVSFSFTPTEAAEHGDIAFKLGLTAPAINKTFSPAAFKVRCDSPPKPVNNLTAGIRSDGRACIGFTLPEDYADADISSVEITYTSASAGTSKTVTETVSPTGTGLTAVPTPAVLNSNDGAYVRYFLPDDVIAGNQYTFTVTPIDASGKKCETPLSASLAGNELYLGYDANGGTGSVAAKYGYNLTTTTTISNSSSLSRPGYGFTDWNTKADGSGTAYAPGASYTFGSSSLMLYALWQKLATVTVSISTPGYQGVTVTQNGTTVTSVTMDKDATLNLSMPAGAIDYRWYLNGVNAGNDDAQAWSFRPSLHAITAGTYTISATATYNDVAYSANIVVLVTNDAMITMLPYGEHATFTEKTHYAGGSISSFMHTITRPYKMGKFEVTYQLWFAVRTWALANGYSIADPGCAGWSGGAGGAATNISSHPVTNVSYADAIVWCNAYSEMTGLTPCYYTSTTDRSTTAILRTTATVDTSYSSAYVKLDANGYRLPTEGEWQYAASCGGYYGYMQVSGCTTDISADTSTYLPYANVHTGITAAVGSLLPNIWGLYDMNGNVWEWCFDKFNTLPTGAQTDYICDSTPYGTCVVRGNSFSTTQDILKSTVGHRDAYAPIPATFDTGFRLVRTITQ